VAAGQAPARHPRSEEPRRYPPHRQKDVQAEGHRLAPATARRASICSAAAAVRSGRIPRSHEIGLPKKVRALALKHALSAKAKDGGIIIIDALIVKEAKTKALISHFAKLGLSNALLVDGAEIGAEVRNAARNIPNIDVLPVVGINVYDIMRRRKLVLTKAAVDALEARFK
jgi:50S ribosomal protein L4